MKYPHGEVMKLFTGCVICILVFISCSSDENPYQNNLGIEPSLIAQMDTANYTTILWEDTLVNIGRIKTTDTARIKFRFKNTGNKPLFIITVAPSCGCTVADYPKEPIQPGKEGVVTASYKWNGQLGELKKTISVRTNTSNQAYHKVAFVGEVFKDSVIVK
ncbi:MAG TPA: DUF1573 domain-containing protein [Panacibacter sp.]|nr:DUF1573 domain-containing protein [Panacibacter sp.]HNP44886.1 DUF1573 domain-containing protein [Panacibacter sp.]